MLTQIKKKVNSFYDDIIQNCLYVHKDKSIKPRRIVSDAVNKMIYNN